MAEPTPGELLIMALRRRFDANDPIDRISYQFTSLGLICVGLVVLLMEYGRVDGDGIRCWTPAQFTYEWDIYTNRYCYAEGTYFLPTNKEIPSDLSDRDNRRRMYYQYVPLVLILQGVAFWLPNWIWKRLKHLSGRCEFLNVMCSSCYIFGNLAGVSVKGVLNAAALVKKDVKAETRAVLVYGAAQHLKESLELQRDLKQVRGRLFFGVKKFSCDLLPCVSS